MLRPVSKKPDPILLFTAVGLIVFGVLMVYDASVVYAHDVFGGKYHFLLKQLSWVVLGGVGGFLVFLIDYQRLRQVALPIFVITLGLLIFLVIPRFVSFPLLDKFVPEVNGARRWIVLNPPGVLPSLPLLGYLSFQPSELAKLALVLYLSAWLAPQGRRGVKTPLPDVISVYVLLSAMGGLILLEPDFATAALACFVGVWLYFVAGAKILPLLISSVVFLLAGVGFVWTSPYRRARLLTFLDPAAADPLSTGYHLRQILIALGSGGLFGLGLGESRQKYEYLPETVGDSIFAIIGEEFGFLGTTALVLVFLLFLWRGFLVARDAPDNYARLLAAGIIGWMSLQVLVNLCAMTALIPLTGVTLPFISYGGSSMVFTLFGLGILLNISAVGGLGSRR